MPEAAALHLVVAHLDDELGPHGASSSSPPPQRFGSEKRRSGASSSSGGTGAAISSCRAGATAAEPT